MGIASSAMRGVAVEHCLWFRRKRPIIYRPLGGIGRSEFRPWRDKTHCFVVTKPRLPTGRYLVLYFLGCRKYRTTCTLVHSASHDLFCDFPAAEEVLSWKMSYFSQRKPPSVPAQKLTASGQKGLSHLLQSTQHYFRSLKWWRCLRNCVSGFVGGH